MKVSVFGLGYVGTITSACLADFGHQVIGVDVKPAKIEMINRGESPVIEKEIGQLIKKNQKAGRLIATTDATQAVLDSDVSLVCVGTPSAENGDLDLKYVERVCDQIGETLATKNKFHTVVIRSTVLPGNTEDCLIPILEKASGKKAGQDFGVAFNPEFLREGSAVEDFNHPSFTVIGQYGPHGAETTSHLYDEVDAQTFVVPLKVAEMVKYTNNTFHALKVTFANEIGNLCKRQGIDSYQVMEIFSSDHKLNLSPYYLKPGFAFGGSCLPKDIRALLHTAHHMDLNLPVIEAILPSNTMQVQHGFEMIHRTGYNKIGILGFSFKAGTDDLRESPMVALIEKLIGKGYQVKVYDKNVSMARVHGGNKAYIEQTIPHIAELMSPSLEEVISDSEVVVIGNHSPEFVPALQQVRDQQVVIDLVRIRKDGDGLGKGYQGICW